MKSPAVNIIYCNTCGNLVVPCLGMVREVRGGGWKVNVGHHDTCYYQFEGEIVIKI